MFDTWARTIGEALLNSLWQGAALTLLAVLLLKLNRRASASSRYLICLATLAAVLALPVLHVVRPAVQVAVRTAPLEPLPPLMDEPNTPMPAVSVSRPTPPPIRLPLEVPAGTAGSILVMLWMAVASIYCLRLALGYRALQGIKSEARPAPAPYDRWWRRWLLFAPSVREPQLRASNRIRLPLTAGLKNPAILFPASLLDKLTEQEARTIWLHELAHVRRLDDWTKLGQKVVEALLFFHPAVHWLGRKLEIEREIACDDWVVRQTGAPRPYAACLAKLAEYAAVHPSSSPAPAMAADKKQIFRRVKMIINKNERTRKTESRTSGVLIAVFLLAIAGAMMAADPIFVLADAQTTEARPTPPTPPAPPEPPSPAPADAVIEAPPTPPTPPTAVEARPVLAPAVPTPPALPAAVEARPVLAPAVPTSPALPAAVDAHPVLAPASPAPAAPPATVDARPVLAPVVPAPPALPLRPGAKPVLAAAVPVPPVPPTPPQAPVADAKPEPRPVPKPAATPKPSPEPRPHPEMDAELREQMKVFRQLMAVQREEMQALSQQIQEEVQVNIQPQAEEMRRLGREIRETVEKEMRPQMDELREMARSLREEHMANLPDEARMAEIRQKMAEVEMQIQATTEEHMRDLEVEMKELQKHMGPSEEVLEKFEEQMRELQLEMEEKAEQMRQIEREHQEKIRQKQKQQTGPAEI